LANGREGLEQIIYDEFKDKFAEVLETLTYGQRMAFVQHYMFGKPYEEIAALYGGTANRIRALAYRARGTIREKMFGNSRATADVLK